MVAGSNIDSTATLLFTCNRILCSEAEPMKKRYRALFSLKNLGSVDAENAIMKCFSITSSALLKHELGYCLGQMRSTNCVKLLSEVLSNLDEETIVRHEAAEALGAIGSIDCLAVLEEFQRDHSAEVAETCGLALRRIQTFSGDPGGDDNSLKYDFKAAALFNSVDPAFPYVDCGDVVKLRGMLLNIKEPLWNRYCAMFSLRNINSEEAIKALVDALFSPDSALFRHEIAFVLGQLQSPFSVSGLEKSLSNTEENSMVRHEAAEALGAVGTKEAISILERFVNDNEQIVKESVEVALDITDYSNSDEFQLISDI